MMSSKKFVAIATYVVGTIIIILSIICFSFIEIHFGWRIGPSISDIVQILIPLNYSEYEFFGVVSMLVGSIFVFSCLLCVRFVAKVLSKRT